MFKQGAQYARKLMSEFSIRDILLTYFGTDCVYKAYQKAEGMDEWLDGFLSEIASKGLCSV